MSLVETSQVLNENLSEATGTAGRLSKGRTYPGYRHPEPEIRTCRCPFKPCIAALNLKPERAPNLKEPKRQKEKEDVPVQAGGGNREGLPSERRPAVPVASERFSFRTWDVSTAFAGRFISIGHAGRRSCAA